MREQIEDRISMLRLAQEQETNDTDVIARFVQIQELRWVLSIL